MASTPEERFRDVLPLDHGMTPNTTADGREYQIRGRLVLGDALETPELDQSSGVRIGGRPYVDEFRTAIIDLPNAA